MNGRAELAPVEKMMERTDYLPMHYSGRPVWIGVYRASRAPRRRRRGERIFTNKRTGETRYAHVHDATATHWLVRFYKSRQRQNATTRLSRAIWRPMWAIAEIWFIEPAPGYKGWKA